MWPDLKSLRVYFYRFMRLSFETESSRDIHIITLHLLEDANNNLFFGDANNNLGAGTIILAVRPTRLKNSPRRVNAYMFLTAAQKDCKISRKPIKSTPRGVPQKCVPFPNGSICKPANLQKLPSSYTFLRHTFKNKCLLCMNPFERSPLFLFRDT